MTTGEIIKINWNDINKIMLKTAEFFKDKYKTTVNQLLEWYLALDKRKTISVNDPSFAEWLEKGIIPMKKMINLFNETLKKILKHLESLEKQGRKLNHEEWKKFTEGYNNVLHLAINFLGCRTKVITWYTSLLIKTRQTIKIKNNINYFKKVCKIFFYHLPSKDQKHILKSDDYIYF